MAKFQTRYRERYDRVPVEGELIFTGEGEMYGNADGVPRPLHSVHTVANLSELNALTAAFRSAKRLYRVGDDLYHWKGTNTNTAADWQLLYPILTEAEVDSILTQAGFPSP